MADTRFYYDYHFSLPLVQLLLKLLGKTQEPVTDTTNREWFSQPRVGTEATTECVTVTFRLPLSVSEITADILRMPCTVEVWYQDRSNNWRPVLNVGRSPLKVRIDRSDTKTWFKWANRCYPVVAKKVQLRLTRYNDGVLTSVPYPVGVRNTLIRRNVYDRSHGGYFEDEVDPMGNIVSKYIRDWDAPQATDDNYTTFWKSAPQPDPSAVVSLYLDVRDKTGAPQVIDKVYLDPVYANQHVNLYYSNDDLVGTRFLSPITLPPPPGTADDPSTLNINWKFGRGLIDTATGTDESYYRWPLNVGPLTEQDAWIGVEWLPNFATTAQLNLAHNPVLFASGPPTDTTAAKPVLSYDPYNRQFVLDFVVLDGGGDVVSASAPYVSPRITEEWNAGDSIKVVAGWRYDADGRWVWMKVVDNRGRTVATLDEMVEDLPRLVSFDGVAEVKNFQGSLLNLVVKLESHARTSDSFLVTPSYYCDPDPALSDDTGRYPSTTLDNAVYAAPFGGREHGSGGAAPSHFEDKEWTPIWRDYIAQKGMLHLPQPISMKFLKMEFTNLTEQPYPIYESGIEVKYKVFPISVTQQSSLGMRLYTGQGGFLGLGTFISANGVKSVNWVDPNSVLQAIGSLIGPQIPPVQVNMGTPYLADQLPNQGAQAVENSRRIEMASSYVYARDTLQPFILAQDQYNTIIKAEGLQAIQPYVDVPWKDIEDANPGAITKVRSLGTVPVRGSDWWIYPGQQLKVPASVMRRITETSTITERKFTLESRVRFNTTSVHRYEWKTVKRDAAIAYFAGVREVQPYTSTYIVDEDVPSYQFPSYTSTHWVFSNTRRYQKPGTGAVENSAITAALPSSYGVISSRELISQSDFTKVSVDFQDSGLIKSNPMWVDIDQNTETVDDMRLSPYFGVIPEDIPRGSWSDALSVWWDGDTVWGSVYGLVRLNVHEELRYQNKRVVRLVREAGAGQAGMKLDQWNNFVPGAQFRVGVVFYRPQSTGNDFFLRLKDVDGNLLIEQKLAYAPAGRWFETTTHFTEIPEPLPNASFDTDLANWIPDGTALWSAVSDKGRTGSHSAKVVTDGQLATLTTEKMDSVLGSTISASAWVSWSGITPGHPIYLNALLYNSDDELVATVALDGQVTPEGASTTGWSLIGGKTTIPAGQGVSQVAFQVAVDGALGSGGTVWVDDFSVNVPGAPGQQYVAELTIEGDEEEEIFVSELYTQITPIRYFLTLGNSAVTDGTRTTTWQEQIEVTDLRYTQNQSIVTATEPANAIKAQALICSTQSYAFGCTITPHYLR